MLLERAAGFFQSQGYAVRVQPCIIGNSGAIHSPDLLLQRPGEAPRVAYVVEAAEGHAPLEAKRGMAQDMGYAPIFVVGRPGDEVKRWAERHGLALVMGVELGLAEAAEAPVPAAGPAAPAMPGPVEAALDTDEDIRAVSPRPPAPRPEPSGGRGAEPLSGGGRGAEPLSGGGRDAEPLPPPAPVDDSGAVLLPGNPRADAPKPRPRMGRSVVQFPTEVPEDGDAMLLDGAPRSPPATAREPPAMADAAQASRWEQALADDANGTGSELLPSKPAAPAQADEGDKLAKHDLSIWNPAARLQLVKQAAKANGFESTGVREPPPDPAAAEPAPPPAAPGPHSAWLSKLRG